MNHLFYISVTHNLEDILIKKTEKTDFSFLFLGLVVKNLYLCIAFTIIRQNNLYRLMTNDTNDTNDK